MSVYSNISIGTDLLECSSTPTISSSVNFSGDVSFNLTNPGENCYIIGKQSYISIQLQIVQVREDGTTLTPLEPIINAGTGNLRATPTAISIPYLCQNPAGALFQNVACYLKGQQISNHQYAETTNTLYRMLYESKHEQDTVLSTNKITPPSINDMDSTLGVTYDGANILAAKVGANANSLNALFSRHMLWAIKNGQYNFDKYTTNRINFQIPVSLFYADEMLHFGNDGTCQLVFNVNPNWATQLIQIAGSNACSIGGPGVGQAYAITTKSTGFTKCTINVSVQDMRLYLCRAHVTNTFVPRSVSQTIALKQFHPFITQLSLNGTTNTITAPMVADRRITHIIVAFLANQGTTFKSSPTDITSGFVINGTGETANTADGQSLIQSVSVTFGGITYPQAVYNLKSDAVASNTNDLFKAFTDYTIFTGGYRDRSGLLMSADQWAANKIFVFNLRGSLNNTNGTCYLNVNLSAPMTVATNVMVLGLYEEFVTLTYDEYSRITEVRKDAMAV